MSATVEGVCYLQGVCDDCGVITGPFAYAPDAEEWAANHNAEHHETDNSTDEDYERLKEARYGD